ncbi:MAG: hypothetical protein ACI9A7_001565 [Cyclobacteriaceae bacterium]|jgi:hypothetical protein
MNKINLAFLILFFSNSAIVCQDIAPTTSLEFGKITWDDLDFTYAKDKEATAVILFDKGHSEFYIDENLRIRFKRQKRIKILQNAGLHYANIEIPYYVDGYGKTEKIKEIKAFSYTVSEGLLSRKKVDLEEVFIENVNANWRLKKFAIPNVQIGTIIEYEYTVETPFLFNLPDWQFQDFIPTLYSEYKMQSVPFYEYTFIAQGLTEFTDSYVFKDDYNIQYYGGASYPDLRSTYIMKDVPAFVDEGYITSPDHYIMKIDFQLSKINFPKGGSKEIKTTWKKMNEELLKHENFGKYIKKAESVFPEYIASHSMNSGSSEELAEKVINTIKKDFNWNGRYAKYADQKTKQLLASKTGNVADLNLFLIAALRSSGFKAFPVLLSTRNHGRISKSYPFAHFFNYVIVYYEVDGKPYLADATAPLLLHNQIPPRCLNEQGLLLKEDSFGWIDLVPHHPSIRSIYAQLEVDLFENTLNAKIKFKATNLEGYQLRKSLKNDSSKLVKYFNEYGLENIHGIKTSNFDNPKRPYSVSLKSSTSLSKIEDQLLIKPFFNFPQQENPFKQKERTYPIDLTYPKGSNFSILINIPTGYAFTEVPEPLSYNDDLMDIAYKTFISNNQLMIVGNYNFKKANYKPTEYPALQKGVAQIVSKFNEYIVLEKND